MNNIFDFLIFVGGWMGVSVIVGVIIFLAVFVYEKIPEKLKTLINIFLVIIGFILFIWVADYLMTGYSENESDKIEKKVDTICKVILSEQPNNLNLYDRCWTIGMEQFNPNEE